MKIKYWTSFSKRKNSTLTPSGGTEIDAVLKGPTSELNPVFELQGVTSAKYVYCATFGRYYYVTDVVHLSNNVIQLICAVDPMSSHKGSIGATYADVEYTSSSTNTDIADPRNKPTNVMMSAKTILTTLSGIGSDYCYVVGINSLGQGARYYAMTQAQFDGMLSNVFDPSFFDQLENNFYDLKNVLLSCSMLPFSAETLGRGPVSIKLKKKDNTEPDIGSGYVIDIIGRVSAIAQGTFALNYPADSLGYDLSYLDYSPYTSGSLLLPYVGTVSLDADIYATNKSIYVECGLDKCTGDMIYKIGLDSDKIMSTYSGSCAANIPICGSSYNAVGAAGGVAAVIGGIAGVAATIATEGSAAMLMGAIGATAGGIGTTITSLQHHTQTNGSLSSLAGVALGDAVIATVVTRRPAETAIDTAYKAVSGMPYFQGATISSLSGYVKCNGASVSISGYDSEREEINGYLNSGFYYE